MSDVVVVYKSKYGSSQRYAHWIADAVGADIYKSKDIKLDDLRNYNTIVFCGGVYAGSIIGFSLIKRNFSLLNRKKIIVVAVGSSGKMKEASETAQKRNFTPEMAEQIRLFMLRGAIDYTKMSMFDKFIMFMIVKLLKTKKAEELDADAKTIIETYGKKVDFTDKNSISPIIDAIKSGDSNENV